MSLFLAARLLHLGAMSVWMGAGLLAPSDVGSVLRKRTLHASDLDALLGRLRRTARTMNAAAYLTLLSGLLLIVLIALGPGVTTIRPKIWLGLVLTLAAIGVGRFLIRPAVVSIAGIRAELVAHGALDPGRTPELERAVRRFALGVHGESALRLIVLILMIS